MLAETIRNAARLLGDHPLVVDEDGLAISAAELDAITDVAAMYFADHGVKAGDVVALAIPSDVAYIAAYGGLAKLGAITAGINPKLSPTEQGRLIESCRPALVIDESQQLRSHTFEPSQGRSVPPLEPNPDRVVALVFTSGTSGTPKAAIFAERQLHAIRDLDLGDNRSTYGGGAPMLIATQMAHVGFMTKLPWYIQTGSTMHLMSRWSASGVLRTVAANAMPVIGGVAPQVALMMRSPAFDEVDLDCVKMLIVGGAASPPALVQSAIEQFGAAYSIRYSSTESGGVGLENTISTADLDEMTRTGVGLERLASIGAPRSGVEATIVDDNGSECADGEVGELCIRSDAVMAGYWDNDAATAASIDNGWLRTGDLASRTGSLYYLAGRRSEMYIRGGYNVFPAEVEAILASHPLVADVAVVGIADDVMGEIGAAAIVVRDPARAPTLEELREFAANDLAEFKLPEALLVVDELPLTAMQKIDKRALAAAITSTRTGTQDADAHNADTHNDGRHTSDTRAATNRTQNAAQR